MSRCNTYNISCQKCGPNESRPYLLAEESAYAARTPGVSVATTLLTIWQLAPWVSFDDDWAPLRTSDNQFVSTLTNKNPLPKTVLIFLSGRNIFFWFCGFRLADPSRLRRTRKPNQRLDSIESKEKGQTGMARAWLCQ